MNSNLKKLGQYIEQVDVRNKDLSVKTLLGVSIEKKFIPSIANTIGTDMKSYKVVKRGQFAYGTVTSRNGDKVSIALLDSVAECIISSAYIVFKITKSDELLAEYLMLLFQNPEFDRYARYNSWGSAREVFSWEELCNTEFHIPSIDEQKKIVKQYKTIEDRIGILKKINSMIEKSVEVQYKNAVLSNQTGKIKIEEIGRFVRGKNITSEQMIPGEYEVISAGLLPSGKHNQWNVKPVSITISGSGVNAGYFSLHFDKIWAADCSFCDDSKYPFFLYESLKSVNDKIEELKDGHTAQPHVYPKDINDLVVDKIDTNILDKFENTAERYYRLFSNNLAEIKTMNSILKLIAQKVGN